MISNILIPALGVGTGIVTTTSKFVQDNIKKPIDNLQQSFVDGLNAKIAERKGLGVEGTDVSEMSAAELADLGISASDQAAL